MSGYKGPRPPIEQMLGRAARDLAALHVRHGEKAEAHAFLAERAEAELQLLHRATEKRFARTVPFNPLLLDVLRSVTRERGDVWRWHGTHNGHGTATIRVGHGAGEQHEWSLVRYLALQFGVITADQHGSLYPVKDPHDVNPWHRVLRVADEPVGDLTGARRKVKKR